MDISYMFYILIYVNLLNSVEEKQKALFGFQNRFIFEYRRNYKLLAYDYFESYVVIVYTKIYMLDFRQLF